MVIEWIVYPRYPRVRELATLLARLEAGGRLGRERFLRVYQSRGW